LVKAGRKERGSPARGPATLFELEAPAIQAGCGSLRAGGGDWACERVFSGRLARNASGGGSGGSGGKGGSGGVRAAGEFVVGVWSVCAKMTNAVVSPSPNPNRIIFSRVFIGKRGQIGRWSPF